MFFYVMTVKSNDKYYASVIKISKSTNLIHEICKLKEAGAIILEPCSTQKEAKTRQEIINNDFIKNGNYLFS